MLNLKNMIFSTLWCIAKVLGENISVHFKVKNVSNLLAASLTALILLRDVNRIQKSPKYVIENVGLL